jgi:sugar lactone lactonase YvrE
MWVALGEAGAVVRFRPDGSVHEVVKMPASFVSSISFGGEDMCEVLITTADNEVSPELGGTLLRARSEIAGLRLAPVSV